MKEVHKYIYLYRDLVSEETIENEFMRAGLKCRRCECGYYVGHPIGVTAMEHMVDHRYSI